MEWWLINYYYFFFNDFIFFNPKLTYGSSYKLYQWVNKYDYGWYVTYSGPASDLIDFLEDWQLFRIFTEFNLFNKTFEELGNELVTTQIFVKSNTLVTRLCFLDAPQLDVNSVIGILYLIVTITLLFSNINMPHNLSIDSESQYINYTNASISTTTLDFYLHDFFAIFF